MVSFLDLHRADLQKEKGLGMAELGLLHMGKESHLGNQKRCMGGSEQGVLIHYFL